MKDNREILLEVKNLKKYFDSPDKKVVKAVDDVSFEIYKGETLGLVGESGSGKSTIGRTIMGIYEPTSGEVKFRGKNVHRLNSMQRKEFNKNAQMIFQDPYSSLDPRMTVGDIIAEGIDVHNLLKGEERARRIEDLLEQVGLDKEFKNRLPHEFSGGQRQRVSIARALALNPEFIVCDEAISALDVSVQAQVVNLLRELQEQYNLTYLFIAHDLSMVRYISDRVVVLYHGRVVELADSDELYSNPIHSYTKSLLSAIPIPDPEVQKLRKRIKFERKEEGLSKPSSGDRRSLISSRKAGNEGVEADNPGLREVKPGHFVALEK